MPRLYTITVSNATVTAATPQDVLAAYAGANRTIRCVGIQMGAITQNTQGNNRFRLRYLPATVTAGSGGSAVTPGKMDPNDAAASFTARATDTTQATTSGTAIDVVSDAFDPLQPYWWEPPQGKAAPESPPSGALVLSMDSVSNNCNLNATLYIEEV